MKVIPNYINPNIANDKLYKYGNLSGGFTKISAIWVNIIPAKRAFLNTFL